MPQYIDVPFADNAKVRALGARWNNEVGSWVVPHGIDLAAFARWLPPDAAALVPAPTGEASTELTSPTTATTTALEAPKGIALSRLLAGVATAVANAYREGVWVRAEVLKVDARGGHVYLELSERAANGDVIAVGRGFIGARTANRILPAFQQATGATLAPGIKVLVRAKPVFGARWGLSLEIDAIDASYTLGDLAARIREIRQRLQREGLFDANRRHEAPEDFDLVLVIAPAEAAGLGDFRADADKLHRHGVCRFVYAHSRFQGDGCAAEILDAARRALTAFQAQHGRHPDAVVLIRGGGAVNDLAWLNDYALARWICECPVPVFTGIGHERDSTILDEVAHTRHDTPSKVIGAIRDCIRTRAFAAADLYEEIMTTIERVAADRRQRSERSMDAVRAGALEAINRARLESERLNATIRAGAQAQVSGARQQVPALMAEVRSGAGRALVEARAGAHRLMAITEERAKASAAQARAAASAHRGTVRDRSQQLLDAGRHAAEGLMREIAGQGPRRTLARGFALVRDAAEKPVTKVSGLAPGSQVTIEFGDGRVEATVGKACRSE